MSPLNRNTTQTRVFLAKQITAAMLVLVLHKYKAVSSSTATSSPRKKTHLLGAAGRTGTRFHRLYWSGNSMDKQVCRTPVLLGHARAAAPKIRGKAWEPLPDSSCSTA